MLEKNIRPPASSSLIALRSLTTLQAPHTISRLHAINSTPFCFKQGLVFLLEYRGLPYQ
jgi:hypothetical protein